MILANKFLVQGTADATLSGAQFLGALATSIAKVTTATGAISAAVAGDFPTLNQNTAGTASNVSGTPALPNGTTATTPAASDNSTKLATTAYADRALGLYPLKSAHLRLTNTQILNATDVQIIAAQTGKVICPVFCAAVGDASGGPYNQSISLSVRYTGNTTSLLPSQSLFDAVHQTRTTIQNAETGSTFIKTTFDPVGVGVTVRATPNSANGNAANYADIILWYFVITDPS